MIAVRGTDPQSDCTSAPHTAIKTRGAQAL